jgi:hypothetical protein
LINGGTRQFIVGEVGGKTQALLQVDGKPFTVEVSFLLIRVNVVRLVLDKSIELSCVVEYTVILLLKVQEYLQLGAEQTRR